VTIIAAGIIVLISLFGNPSKTNTPEQTSPAEIPQIEQTPADKDETMISLSFIEPLDNTKNRVTKKPFGIYITPQNSPTQPERFFGYHTGADFETFENEKDIDVAVRAICDGILLQKRTASGYGGIAVQECQFEGIPITVVYGHLRLSSIGLEIGGRLKKNDFIGYLGQGDTKETDGERKHLHLGIHKGNAVDIKGYVAREKELESWVDPITLLP